ncbi:hypothetical protein EIP91_002797 [Steccherinum ochraceum]|uniref:Uncharacterized protein n=1 Tax=Steccherinum ochraceum TaxID=92696 RepID=A0A4R0RBH4_9APHY|nr:hypothetical protein EIP91_002797 [Steccherinum ochraceum]
MSQAESQELRSRVHLEAQAEPRDCNIRSSEMGLGCGWGFKLADPYATLGKSIAVNVFVILGLFGSVAFSTLRIWAIWGHNWVPTLAVFLTSAVVPAINLYGYSTQTSFAIEGKSCFSNSPITQVQGYRRTSWVPLIVSHTARTAAITNDLLVLVLTWIQTADVWRECMRIKGFKPALTTLLLRDGSLYFGILLIMNIVTLILDSVQAALGGGSSFIEISDAVSANLLARFILDLRSVYDKGSHDAHSLSTVRFGGVDSLAGNMGAPLRTDESTWVSSTADDIANEQDHQYHEVVIPFRAGLGLDEEEIGLEDVPSSHEALESGPANGRITHFSLPA